MNKDRPSIIKPESLLMVVDETNETKLDENDIV